MTAVTKRRYSWKGAGRPRTEASGQGHGAQLIFLWDGTLMTRTLTLLASVWGLRHSSAGQLAGVSLTATGGVCLDYLANACTSR